MLDLESAIKHCEEVADKKKREKQKWDKWLESDYDHRAVAEKVSCKLCADEHRQLAEWLKELKGYRSIKDQIAFAKRNIQSENSDYLTGYLSALSAVEGMIAEHEFEEREDEE